MSFTVVMTSELDTSENLSRSPLTRLYAAWPSANVVNQIVSVAHGVTEDLIEADTYVIQADPLGSALMVVGWIFNSNTVEIPLNQITVVSPPATPYLRNTSTNAASTPVPVRVVAFS